MSECYYFVPLAKQQDYAKSRVDGETKAGVEIAAMYVSPHLVLLCCFLSRIKAGYLTVRPAFQYNSTTNSKTILNVIGIAMQ